MADISQIFKAYDIRGKVSDELTNEIVERVGKAFADWLPETGLIAVGHDMRPDSKELSQAMIKGLTTQGRDVMDIGEVTSDMIYFAVGNFSLAGGAMITASHNPGEFNGIKLCREEAKPVGEESGLFEIRDKVIGNQFKSSKKEGQQKQKDIIEDWVSHVLSFIDVRELKPLHIAVDAGNGMAGKIFPELEPYVPFQIEEMFFELDGTFPNHIANPLEPKNLVDLQSRINKDHCDAGIAFDGDGDRAVLVDEKGEPLSGTILTALLAQYFLEKNPGGTILYNAICGRAAIEAITQAGGNPIRTRVGHSFIKSDMRKYKALLAGEHSGHYYFKDNFCADSGLIAAMIGLYILSQSGKTLSALAAPLRQAYFQLTETNFEVDNKKDMINKIADVFSDGKQDYLDGLTVNYPDFWFNVRPSNTEALLRLNSEAKTKSQLDTLVDRVTRLVKE